MTLFNNHKFLTIMFLLLGTIVFAVCFLLYQKLAFDSDQEKINQALVAESADQVSPLLPDIKKNEPITNSQIRNEEIKKVKAQLPYNDPEGRYSIIYYDKTSVLQVEINAKNIAEYRDSKASAEVVLSELGADNVCNLVALWAVPTALNREIVTEDITTTGCSN